MAGLSSPGIGSGLDVSGIVTKLMSIEQAPLTKLQSQQATLQSQLSAYGQLKSAVSQFQTTMTTLSDVANFKFAQVTSSTTTVATASADSTASKGSYALDVKRIAENHRLVAGTVFTDIDKTKIGATGDKMTIKVGVAADSPSFTVDIGGKTLDEIRTAINSAADNRGVTASTLHDDTGFHLTLSANDTGSTHFVTPTYSNGGVAAADPFALAAINTDRDASGGFTSADLDAQFKVENTFTITRSSNAVSDVIAGVTLNLVGAGTTTLNVARDNAKISDSVTQFVNSYNVVLKTSAALRTQGLQAESGSLLSLDSQFRDQLHAKSGTSKQFSLLAEIGVTTAADGSLTINSTLLQNALQKDPDGLADMFSNATSGAAVRSKKLADTLLGAGGMLPGREQTTKTRIDANAKEQANMQFRLTQKQAMLQKQYTTLDTLIAGLNTTSSYLTSQIAQFTANKNA